MKRLRKSPLFLAGLVILAALLVIAVFGGPLMPNDPNKTDLYHVLSPPGGAYPLGTDDLGRCVLSRLVAGCRTTLGAAVLVEACVLSLGLAVGIAAGYWGGRLDALVVGIIDILLAFPSLILALVIAGLLGPGLGNLMGAMIAVYWVEHARVARAMVRSVKGLGFITASRALGTGALRLLRQHVLPHILPSMLVYSTMNMSSLIIGISSMSFIGLGVRPPTAEWGAMLTEARAYMNTNPLPMILAIACILLAVACFQLLGEAMRDILEPRHSQLGIRKGRWVNKRAQGR